MGPDHARAGRCVAALAGRGAVRRALCQPLRHCAHGHQCAVHLPGRPGAGARGPARGHCVGDERHLADPHGGGGAREPGHLVPGLYPRGPGPHRRADRPRGARRLSHPGGDGGHTDLRQPREQHPHRLFHAAQAQPAPGLGRHGAPGLGGGHLPAHAAAPRHAAFRELLCHARRAHHVVQRDARFLGTRPPELAPHRGHPPPLEGAAGHQGRAQRGGRAAGPARGGRRHRAVQPWRAAARRRGVGHAHS